ncbi:MAG: polyprenyl synthetase family protein [Myxococcales bacterium]|nr:polyprenyl synthetase family protein [Myxococcales bacterium]
MEPRSAHRYPFQPIERLESELAANLPAVDVAPEILHRAMHRAIFAGGKRIRPRVLLTVAAACGAPGSDLAIRAACAIEYVHAASLVHDDLPCFDDADERRGQPTLHRVYGEAMAVLAGDALLARAFEVLSGAPKHARRALKIVHLFSRATGTTHGLIGGQGLEESIVEPGSHDAKTRAQALLALPPDDLDRYHAMKTVALFRLATESGAIAGGAKDPTLWAEVGNYLGLAYKLLDDLGATRGRAPDSEALRAAFADKRARLEALLDTAWTLGSAQASDPRPLRELLGPIRGYIAEADAG